MFKITGPYLALSRVQLTDVKLQKKLSSLFYLFCGEPICNAVGILDKGLAAGVCYLAYTLLSQREAKQLPEFRFSANTVQTQQ